MDVSIQRGWHNFKDFRSNSSEWPRRIGVGVVGEEVRIERRWVCTSDNVVVTGSRASSVIPDQL
jgi:hypothetical protein